MHQRVLISNRGEIAIRIARAARALGIESIGVFARRDALALHPRMTTTSVELRGDAVAAYLDGAQIIATAKAHRADCIHPGYGFLSENAEFAAACAEHGIDFIGPPPAALSLFGNKVRARALALSLGIPVVPGSHHALQSAQDASAIARDLGFPVMLKAAAGGGGRGMRMVAGPDDMASAFARCSSEAQAAFGDGSLFVEKLVARPRHIEVQILADRHGNVVHLFERDCSVQLRNQKVLEIAPAPNLDGELRARLLADALNLARAADYSNAGTVEFLVAPETGEYFFIECNPRIQVEHTVTEQITGVDLVEAQFQIAGGASLEAIGLATQQTISSRGFALQARVVAQGVGRIGAYKEPTGAGIRVDACGYSGYEPPPEFDPLLAKVIVTTPANVAYESVVRRALNALAEFHIGGLKTNLGQLQAILRDPSVRAGDARTTLLSENADLGNGTAARTAAITLFERQAPIGRDVPAPGRASGLQDLAMAAGEAVVRCPMNATVVEVAVTTGHQVNAGDALLVISAMKMETPVTAPCAGVVTALQTLSSGDAVSEGDMLVVLRPVTNGDAIAASGAAPWARELEEVAELQRLAAERLAPGSDEPGVVRQRNRGKLTCRERIELVLDEGTFREVGSIAGFATYDDEGGIAAFTPANSVGGWGKVDGRAVVVCADDFTSRGGHADGAIGAKSTYLDRLSIEAGIPSIRMLDGSSGGGSVAAMVPQQKKEGESKAKESSGAISAGRPRVAGGGGSFLPGHLGSSMYAEQLSRVPVVNLLLGSVVGIGAAKAVLGHFSVMVRDMAQLFVAGPPVVAHAMGYDITKEDLGGWHVHCRNGSVDNLAETEAEAVAMTRRFLSYLPSSVYEAPPVVACSDPSDRREDELATIVPRKRTTTFDVRRAIELIADMDSFFEIGPLWGTDQITGFVRFKGHSVGVIASDSRHVNGGALTADGCDKLKRHLDLCDLFHVPVLNLVDNPGFAVGLEHEIAGTIRKGGEWMIAFAQVEVPIFTVLMRRSFGVAGNNYATPRSRPAFRVVWPAADVGGIPPEGGIEAAYKRQLAEAEDPAALRAELNARIESARGPVGPLNRFQMEEMIDPRDTRRYVCEWVDTAYRTVSQPARLQPRPLQFRP